MKTNINSRLFQKQINLNACNNIMGGRYSTGSSETTYSGPNGNQDETTTHYDEDCNIVSIDHCNY